MADPSLPRDALASPPRSGSLKRRGSQPVVVRVDELPPSPPHRRSRGRPTREALQIKGLDSAVARMRMPYSSSSKNANEGTSRLRKTSAPTPNASATMTAPKPHSRSVDQGVQSPRTAPRRAPPPIPSIELHRADSVSRYALGTPSSVRIRPAASTTQLTTDVPGFWRNDSLHRTSNSTPGGGTGPSMDVPLQLDRRARRPKMHVSIPAPQQSLSIAYNPHRWAAAGDEGTSDGHRSRSTQPAVSRSWWPASNHGTRMPSARAVQSPPERSVQSPARSAVGHSSLRGLGLGQQAASSSSSLSTSSDENPDEDRSSCHSGRTSMSSVTAESAVKVRPSPTNSLASSTSSPTVGKAPDLKLVTTRSPQPVRSKLSTVDLCNKPLPPEPADMAPAPLALAGRPLGLARKPPSPHPPLSHPVKTESTEIINKTPATPRSAPSLKSKYSSSDLDSIDRAFQQASPRCERSALQEAEQALQAQLSTINEDDPFRWDDLPGMSSPLQISRGPMEMNPTRAPPPTPKVHALEPIRIKKKNRLSIASYLTPQIRSPLRRASLVDRGRTKAKDPRDNGSLSPLRYHPPGFSSSSPSISASPTRPSTGASASSTTAEPGLQVGAVDERNSVLTLEDALCDIYSDRSVYLTSPYASSSALPLSPKSVSPKSAEFLLPVQQPSPDSAVGPTTESLPIAPQVKISSRRDDDDDDESVLPRRGRRKSSLVMSLVSLAVSEIPDWYLNMPSSSEYAARLKQEAGGAAERNIKAEAAEAVILSILQSLDNLQDLFSTAVVSRGFYRTFKRNELALMKNALKGMSPAAWELREMTPPFTDGNTLDEDRPMPEYTPSTYLRHYIRDLYVMVALKSLILARCKSFLRPDTLSALAGGDDERSLQLDDAFWRVWTFCKIFGNNKNREDDRQGQLDWLRGRKGSLGSLVVAGGSSPVTNSVLLNPPECFGTSNRGGLLPNELWDMLEIWTCLGVLLQGFHRKAEMARDAGIYDELDVVSGNVAREDTLLEEWVSYLVTLGPSVVLELATALDQPGSRGFITAAQSGLTKWSPPGDNGTRSNFLKDVVTQVYQEKMNPEPRSRSKSSDSAANNGNSNAHHLLPPETMGSTSLDDDDGRALPPELSSNPTPRTSRSSNILPKQQVEDPVDKALWDLVGMGFPVEQARRALAQTDTGERVDVRAAIDLCLRWTKEEQMDGGLTLDLSQPRPSHHLLSSSTRPEYREQDGTGTGYARLAVAAN